MSKDPEKKVPTLMSLLMRHGIVLLVLLLVFILTSLWIVRRGQNQQLAREELASIEAEVVEIRADLEQHQAILSEFYGETLSRVELYREDPQIQYFGKNETVAFLERIEKYNPRIGVLFTGKKDSFLIMNHMPGMGNSFEPRRWIQSQMESPDNGKNNYWRFLELDGTAYFCFTTYEQAHDLLAGNLVPVDQLTNSLRGTLVVPHSFEILDGEEVVYRSGDEIERERFSYEFDLPGNLRIRGQVGGSPSHFFQIAPLTVLVVGVIFLFAFLAESRILYTRYARPMMALTESVTEAEKDPEHASISEDDSTREMQLLSSSISRLADEVLVRRMAAYEYQLKEQDMELMMLRSQLRPHFYLNALTTIDAMTYQGRDEDIRRFLQALSVHVRYMLRTDESRITLGEEIRHIEAYLKMQEIRHPGKIVHLCDVPEELTDIKIPHLILYTVVENSFKYAFGAEDTLLLMISAEELDSGEKEPEIKVRIEDNGKGYPEEILEEFSSEEIHVPEERKHHIGLHNVRRTLELWYGKNDLMKLHNSHMGGAVTELYFPRTDIQTGNLAILSEKE